jgi:hypothetical protein
MAHTLVITNVEIYILPAPLNLPTQTSKLEGVICLEVQGVKFISEQI